MSTPTEFSVEHVLQPSHDDSDESDLELSVILEDREGARDDASQSGGGFTNRGRTGTITTRRGPGVW